MSEYHPASPDLPKIPASLSLWRTVFLHRHLVMWMAVLGAAVGLVMVMLAPSVYYSRTVIQIEPDISGCLGPRQTTFIEDVYQFLDATAAKLGFRKSKPGGSGPAAPATGK